METPGAGSEGPPPEPGWLSNWRAGPIPVGQALSRFDELSGHEPEAMIGQWQGTGLRTNHALDGLLERLGWYGNAFDSLDCVHPLLFCDARGDVVPLNPAVMPVGIALRWPGLARSLGARLCFAAARPILRTHRPAAVVRKVEFRGRLNAAMIYDRQPIIDHFRRIDDDRALGLMDMRGMEPLFFLLVRKRSRKPR